MSDYFVSDLAGLLERYLAQCGTCERISRTPIPMPYTRSAPVTVPPIAFHAAIPHRPARPALSLASSMSQAIKGLGVHGCSAPSMWPPCIWSFVQP